MWLDLPSQPVEGEAWPPIDHEHVAVVPQGASYRVAAPPIFSDAVRYGDVIQAEMDGCRLRFQGVIASSEVLSIRVVPSERDGEEARRTLGALFEILCDGGCVVADGHPFPIYAIALQASNRLALALILSAEDEGVWECDAWDKDQILGA